MNDRSNNSPLDFTTSPGQVRWCDGGNIYELSRTDAQLLSMMVGCVLDDGGSQLFISSSGTCFKFSCFNDGYLLCAAVDHDAGHEVFVDKTLMVMCEHSARMFITNLQVAEEKATLPLTPEEKREKRARRRRSKATTRKLRTVLDNSSEVAGSA